MASEKCKKSRPLSLEKEHLQLLLYFASFVLLNLVFAPYLWCGLNHNYFTLLRIMEWIDHGNRTHRKVLLGVLCNDIQIKKENLTCCILKPIAKVKISVLKEMLSKNATMNWEKTIPEACIWLYPLFFCWPSSWSKQQYYRQKELNHFI